MREETIGGIVDFSLGRDIAIVWLSLFCIVGLLVPIVALYFAIRGMAFAQKRSIELLQQGHGQITRLHQQTERVSEQTIEPILRVRSRITRAKATAQRFTRRQ